MLTDLLTRWRTRAEELRPYAAPAAEAFTRAADELDAEIRTAADESLGLSDAARESGYSERRLRELVAGGELENVGRKGSPRFRRGDLPHRPKRAGSKDPQALATEILGKMRAG